MTITDGEEAGKLFVGGLSWETSKDNLQHYFSQYGEVVDSVVMKNPATGRSRGFGFVTFKDSNCVSLVLQSGPHELDGRTIDPKACTPKSEQQKNRRDDGSPKIFLGGLPPDITETEIRSALMEFGRVSDVVIMYDQEKKKSRGFGFLSYDSEDSVEQACARRFVTINGKQIECKRAEPRSASRRAGRADNQWGGDGMSGQSQNRSWGPGASGGMSQNMGTSAPNGALSSGYQSWGSQVPQAPFTQQGAYGGGYQNWNAPPTGYNTAPSTYGQTNFSGYGAPTSYSYTGTGTGASMTSSQVATDPISSSSSASSAAVNPPPQGSNPYGSMGTYTQDSTSYGPSRGYTAPAGNTQAYGGTQGFGSSTSTYGAYSEHSNQPNRSQSAGQQSYHPYRR